jgi:hypothetical protein
VDVLEGTSAKPTSNPKPDEPWWHPVRDFAIHVTVGLLIFALIATPALLIDWCLARLSIKTVPLVWGLRIGEYAIFGADLVLFLVFLVRTVWRTGKRL